MVRLLQSLVLGVVFLCGQVLGAKQVVTKIQSTVICSTSSGSTKITPVPRTTSTTTFQSNAVSTVTFGRSTTKFTPPPATVTSTAVNTIWATTTIARTVSSPTTTYVVTTTSTSTLVSTSILTEYGVRTITSSVGPSYTITASVVVTQCSMSSANATSVAHAKRAAKSIYPTQAYCTNLITYVTQGTTSITVAVVTSTAATPTSTQYLTISTTSTLTVNQNAATITSTAVLTTTSTTPSISLSYLTSTITSSAARTTTVTLTATTLMPAPTLLSLSGGDYDSPYNYTLYYHSHGFLLNNTNPADPYDDSWPPITTSLASTLNECQAIQQCANLTVSMEPVYYSFALSQTIGNGSWMCVQYFWENDDSSYWSVKNDSVGNAYGFSVEGYM